MRIRRGFWRSEGLSTKTAEKRAAKVRAAEIRSAKKQLAVGWYCPRSENPDLGHPDDWRLRGSNVVVSAGRQQDRGYGSEDGAHRRTLDQVRRLRAGNLSSRS